MLMTDLVEPIYIHDWSCRPGQLSCTWEQQ